MKYAQRPSSSIIPAESGSRCRTRGRERRWMPIAPALLLLFAMMPLACTAEESAAPPPNVLITDEATDLLSSFVELCIYPADSYKNVRLSETPVARFPDSEHGASNPAPTNPLSLCLDVGRYELTVRVFWLPFEVSYLFFVVAPEQMNVVDLLMVAQPDLLMTY